MKYTKEIRKENGITLIALVITIIVLLILAGVSIGALGGQNGILTNATEVKRKSEIGDVKDQARLDIVTKQTEKLEPEITADELRKILEKYGTIEGEGKLLDQTLVTENGYEIPVKEIWGGAFIEEETPTKPLDLQIGDYVRYDVTYTDVYTGYEFTAENGWRVLNPGTDNGDGTVSGLKLISTGIPLNLNYQNNSIKNIENNGEYGNWAGNATQREQYIKENHISSINNYNSMYAAAGLRYNFGKIKFSQGTSSNENEGYYSQVNGKTSEILIEEELLKGGGEEVHNLTLAELNEARGESNLTSTTRTNEKDGATGLFYLKALNKYNYNSNSSQNYWLSSQYPPATGYLGYVSSDGNIGGSQNNTYGIRPVISLPNNFRIEEIEE